MGEMRRELQCDEASEEPPTVATESVLKIECNINITTNYMATGIMNVRHPTPPHPCLLALGLTNGFCAVTRSESRKALTLPWTASHLHPEITNDTAPQLPHSTHGTVRMEARYHEKGQNHGASLLPSLLPFPSPTPPTLLVVNHKLTQDPRCNSVK